MQAKSYRPLLREVMLEYRSDPEKTLVVRRLTFSSLIFAADSFVRTEVTLDPCQLAESQ